MQGQFKGDNAAKIKSILPLTQVQSVRREEQGSIADYRIPITDYQLTVVRVRREKVKLAA